MKIVKTLGFLILGLLALALIIGAFQPTHFEYERSTDINASKEAIFAKINDLKSFEEWGPWKQEDTTMQITYGEKTEGLGASYSWSGEKSGNGTLTVSESTPPTWQKTDLEFDGRGGSNGWFKLDDGENGATKTSWGFAMDIPYPMNAMTLFTGGSMEKEMNRMFDLGLSNLKEMCEKEAAEKTYRGYAVNSMEFPGKSYLAIRETVGFQNIAEFYTKNFGIVMNAMTDQKLEKDGMPCGVFYVWNEEEQTTDMAAAIPVKGGTPAAAGSVQPIEVPKGKCMTIDYYGDYSGSGEAHYAMDDYFKEKGMEPAKLVMEEYVTDPTTEPDTSKWLTKIYYFMEGPLASGE